MLEEEEKETTYEEKLEAIRSPLLSFCLNRIFNKQDAEDVVQDTMGILLRKKSDCDKSKSFQAWAFRICRFQIMAYLTSVKRSKTKTSLLSESPTDSLSFSISCVENFTPFDFALKKELKEEREIMLRRISNRLSPKLKEFFNYSMEGKSKDAIIDLMNLNGQGHYFSLKRRAIHSIRDKIQRGMLS